jgi:Na+/H+ antiporter NhaB
MHTRNAVFLPLFAIVFGLLGMIADGLVFGKAYTTESKSADKSL